MSCDYTFDELEEFAARINNMSSDEHGAAGECCRLRMTIV